MLKRIHLLYELCFNRLLFRYLIAFAFVFNNNSILAQTTAGNAVYNFIELPYSAKITSLGGINISSIGSDLGQAMYNPSLLSPEMENQIHLGIKPFFAGIQQYDFNGVKYLDKHNITWSYGIHFMDYGNIKMTDYTGNEIGTMHPNDYLIQLSAATNYIEQFRIGGTLKYINSNYGLYKSSGVALDIALKYQSPNKLSQASLLVRNIGTQLGNTSNRQELPFNLILGWTKKLAFAPVQFSVTADRLSVWNNLYYDPEYAMVQGDAPPSSLQNVFNHLTLASEIFIGDQFNLNLGYNFIRRYDLNVQNQANGLNGFSTGIGIKLERINIDYGTSYFQRNMYHHFSITYQLKK